MKAFNEFARWIPSYFSPANGRIVGDVLEVRAQGHGPGRLYAVRARVRRCAIRLALAHRWLTHLCCADGGDRSPHQVQGQASRVEPQTEIVQEPSHPCFCVGDQRLVRRSTVAARKHRIVMGHDLDMIRVGASTSLAEKAWRDRRALSQAPEAAIRRFRLSWSGFKRPGGFPS